MLDLYKRLLKQDYLAHSKVLPDSDLIIMQDKVLNIKDQRHKGFVFGDSSVSKTGFLEGTADAAKARLAGVG